MIVPIVCLMLGVFMLAATAFFTLRDTSKSTGAVTIGGAFALIDQDGKALTPREFQGRPYLVFFGYTHCPDVCPTTLMELTQVFEALGEKARVSALFVTVDPERDTPAVLKDYLSSFDKRMMGATGPRDAIDAALKSFRVFARRVPGTGEDYTMDHSAVVYLMDKQGRFVSGFNLQQTPQQAAQSLKPYL